MHLKFYRDQKIAARKSLGWKWNDTECELTAEEWVDWQVAHGKVMPCKARRRWRKFIGILGAIFYLSLFAVVFCLSFASASPLQLLGIVGAFYVIGIGFRIGHSSPAF